MLRFRMVLSSVILSLFLTALATDKIFSAEYHKPEEVHQKLKTLASQYPQLSKLLLMGKSVNGRELLVLRLAAKAKDDREADLRPAVFVSANLEGIHLGGTEAALALAERLVTQHGKDEKITRLLEKRAIYIAPLLNPDASQNYFASIRQEKPSNAQPVDDDLDGMVDEDGPDDLNNDGLITQMRVKDPEGEWLPDPQDPRLMKRADPKKGEKGIYALYTEGLDNDGDEKYNEDPVGGIELNRNFPHDFEYYHKSAGLWPVSTQETIALLDFLTSHRNIALILNFSTENTILNLQQTGRAAAAAGKIRVPRRYATFLGLDPEREYDIQEIITILRGSGMFMGMEINESMVAMMLGLGPALSLDRQDLAYIEAIQKDYKEGLKKAKLDYPEKRAKGVGKGSFVAYCYYQHGVQVFSTDLWAVPEPKKEQPKDALTPERLKVMTSEEFLALGEEKIDAFLKVQGAPPNFNASALIKMVESGRVTPARMVEMMERMPQRPGQGQEGEEHPEAYLLKWSDAVLEGKGFVNWTPFKHPTLGEVEIGGFVPFLTTAPPPSEIEKAISFHLDFYLDLMQRLPWLEVKEVKVKALEEGLYQVSAYFANSGWFPASTAQGRRARTAWPVRIELKTSGDQSLFSGRSFLELPGLEGSGDTKKVEWTIRGKKGSKITITASSPKLNTVAAAVVLE